MGGGGEWGGGLVVALGCVVTQVDGPCLPAVRFKLDPISIFDLLTTLATCCTKICTAYVQQFEHELLYFDFLVLV